ncbi:hypothetical protein COO59_07120 [Mixta theicola]|uniref:Pyosin/cloacin translocation domain-containing protein n=1 Tax=Mixta theicola TaxID=1458355 RepID=A0A2K1QB63_9GAMM|nr:S-type pyocin domain-containing protein [Mixta theicola]PNS12271.1 hypothetical protein COO59_07120 [Mixta theicola]GLR08028.1 hypothetical protein GCM10007905_07470 [Mixta theicola]
MNDGNRPVAANAEAHGADAAASRTEAQPVDTGLCKHLGNGQFQFASQYKPCFLTWFEPLSWTWTMDRGDEWGVAICFATEKERRAAIAELTGFAPLPHYTLPMVDAAQAAMEAAGALALGNAAGQAQLAVAGRGAMAIAGSVVNALSRAWSELSRVATVSAVGARLNAASLLLWSPEVGKGSDRVPLALSLPLNAMSGANRGLKPGAETAQLPARSALTVDNDGISLTLHSTGSSGLSPEVPVLRPVRDPVTGLDRITLPATADAPELTILINPTAPSNTGNHQPVPVTPVHTGTEVKPVENPVIITTPAADSVVWRDFIYWRPDAAGTGVEPVYVVVSSPRNMPGVVTGKGEAVGDKWLHKAGEGTGAPVPEQIANKLRGREFASFDAFRRAFWLEVGKDPGLAQQFNKGNLVGMQDGLAPFPPRGEQVGGRDKYEIHHIKPIVELGAVYDVDNLGVVSPKRHIKIHSEKKS